MAVQSCVGEARTDADEPLDLHGRDHDDPVPRRAPEHQPELYEAASIDGASQWQRFRFITWPVLTPTTFFIFVMSCIGGLQGGFDMAFVMTKGGPAGATTTIMYHIFNNALTWNKMGYAASMAWFLFVIILGVTLINWRYGGRVVHY